MPVATASRVEALARDLGSQRRLAEALGVSPARVSRWIRGEGMDPANVDRVEVLELAVARLLRLYGADAARRWLVGVNPHLGDRRPLDVVRSGRGRELLDAIDADRAHSFA